MLHFRAGDDPADFAVQKRGDCVYVTDLYKRIYAFLYNKLKIRRFFCMVVLKDDMTTEQLAQASDRPVCTVSKNDVKIAAVSNSDLIKNFQPHIVMRVMHIIQFGGTPCVLVFFRGKEVRVIDLQLY